MYVIRIKQTENALKVMVIENSDKKHEVLSAKWLLQ